MQLVLAALDFAARAHICQARKYTGSIVARDPDLAQVHMAEKGLLLLLLADGDAQLWAGAKARIDTCMASGPGGRDDPSGIANACKGQ
jgi:hypothetical protein